MNNRICFEVQNKNKLLMFQHNQKSRSNFELCHYKKKIMLNFVIFVYINIYIKNANIAFLFTAKCRNI